MTFETFFELNYTRVLRYLLGKLPNRDDAEDLTQSIFLYCYEKYSSYDPQKSSLTTWLFLIVNGRLKNYYRDRKEYVDLGEVENFLSADDNEMVQAVYLESVKQALTKAMDTLTEKQRRVVIEKYFKGKKHSEIADSLGISEINSRQLLNKALSKLQEEMKDFI